MNNNLYLHLLSNVVCGREKETAIIKNALNYISKGNIEIVHLKGSSGTGKTTLVKSIFSTRADQNILFISGKFEQHNDNEPYIAFVQAFRSLLRRILTEPKDKLNEWKKKLIKALGRNAAVISRMIPEIQYIIGKQELIEQLDPEKTKRRFYIVCGKFIRVFSSNDRPLVLFLDDLQWADDASLQLLHDICKDHNNNRHLLLVIAYRSDEINDTCKNTLKQIEALKIINEFVSLDNLNFSDTKKLVAYTLKNNIKEADKLSEIIYRKTVGNPFYIKELLISILEDKSLWFNQEESSWEWQIDQIKSIEINNNILSLIIRKIKNLSDDNIQLLKMLSCIGKLHLIFGQCP